MLDRKSTETSRTVLVTGCSTGIGRALASELHARGHRVFATARNRDALSELASAGITTLALDVNAPESVEAAVAKVIASAGGIDVLINNAGVNAFGPLMELPLEALRSVMDTNVVGLTAVTQAVFPHMADRRSGLVINLGSVVGLLPTPFAEGYCASKSAVHMLSEARRIELAPPRTARSNLQRRGVPRPISRNALYVSSAAADDNSMECASCLCANCTN